METDTARIEEELERVEYLLVNGLWDDERHRMELRQRQIELMDVLAWMRGE